MVKDEGRLPTGSFKARGLALAVAMAREFGLDHLAIPTNGNAKAAMAAYAARAGLRATVFCPSDMPDINIREIQQQGATTFLVDGPINECGKIVGEGREAVGWFDVSTLMEPGPDRRQEDDGSGTDAAVRLAAARRDLLSCRRRDWADRHVEGVSI